MHLPWRTSGATCSVKSERNSSFSEKFFSFFWNFWPRSYFVKYLRNVRVWVGLLGGAGESSWN